MGLRKLKLRNKKAAFEMSITTIVILVIAMTMLILGMILVRKMMCGAMGLTTDINDKVRGQVDDLFQSQGGEVQCIGSGAGSVDLIPGKTNYIWCGIQSPKNNQQYDITFLPSLDYTKITQAGWIVGQPGFSGKVSTDDNEPKKILRLAVPKNAEESSLILKISVTGSGGTTTKDLDFTVRRLDWFRGTIC